MRMILILTSALLLTACGGGGGGGGASGGATLSQGPAGDSGGTTTPDAPDSPESSAPVAKSISMTTTVGQLVRKRVSEEEVTITVNQPRHGEASAVGTTVGYRPAPGFLGTDSFDYTVISGGKSASARITVEVSEPAFFGEYPFACPSSSTSGPAEAHRIAAHGKVHGQLLAIVRDGLGFRTRLSSDSGETWEAGGALSVADVTGVYFEPTSEDLVFAETTDGLWQSVDGGRNWTLIDAGFQGAFDAEIKDTFRTERTYVLDGTGATVVSDFGEGFALVTPDPTNGVRHLTVDGWGRIFLARATGVECIDGLDNVANDSPLSLTLSETAIEQGGTVDITLSGIQPPGAYENAELTIYVTGEAIGPGDPTALPIVPKVIHHRLESGSTSDVSLNFKPESAGNFIITAVQEGTGTRYETSNLLQVQPASSFGSGDVAVTIDALGGDRYRASVSNLDGSTAQDVVIGLWNPAELRIQNVLPDQGTCADDAIADAYRCRLGSIWGGEPVSVTFDAVHIDGGPVDIHAMVDALESDPDLTNNQASLIRSGKEFLATNLVTHVGPSDQLIGGFYTSPGPDDAESWLVESLNYGDWAADIVVRGHIIARDPDGRVRPFVASDVAVGDADCVTSFAQRPGRPQDIVSYECRPTKALEPEDPRFINSVVPTGSVGEVLTHATSISGTWDAHDWNNLAISSSTVSEPFDFSETPSPDGTGECAGLAILITWGACQGGS